MRRVGTILSPECKNYAKDIQTICDVPEYINLQMLRLIESLICQKIAEQVQENKKQNKNEPIVVEIPLVGNLTITSQIWHKHHLRTDKPSTHINFEFEPLPTFKNHVSKIYNNDDCPLISLLSESYAKILVDTYKDLI
jgi:hypothetical protein